MDETNKKPLLDSLVDSKELQILKTIIPYLPDLQQKRFAMTIRFIEFIKTTELFEQANRTYTQELHACSGESGQERMTKMLYAIKELCNKQEQEQIDMLLNIFEVSNEFGYF